MAIGLIQLSNCITLCRHAHPLFPLNGLFWWHLFHFNSNMLAFLNCIIFFIQKQFIFLREKCYLAFVKPV